MYHNSAGAGGYVVYPTGAKKLLDHGTHKGIAPADSHIPSCHSLRSLQIEPAIAVQLKFYEYYNLGKEYEAFATSSTGEEPLKKREWIFRIKRTIAQVKLGFYKLRVMPKSDRRFVELRSQDFLR